MLAVMNTDDGIRTVEVEEPQGTGVRLAVAAAGICGTDVLFAGREVSGFLYGHEFVGVDETGKTYFVEPTIYGGKCEQCRGGNTQRCTEPGCGNLGFYREGGMAGTVAVPEYTLLSLPAELDVKDACRIDPGSVAWHAVRRAQVQPGERVLVVGAGSIGLLAAAAAAHHGLDVEVDTRRP